MALSDPSHSYVPSHDEVPYGVPYGVPDEVSDEVSYDTLRQHELATEFVEYFKACQDRAHTLFEKARGLYRDFESSDQKSTFGQLMEVARKECDSQNKMYKEVHKRVHLLEEKHPHLRDARKRRAMATLPY
jgi:hypothetical protein